MPAVAVSILRVVDGEGFPESVECELIDRFGKAWRFVEKLPVIEATSSQDRRYPRPGAISCQIIETGYDGQGRAFVQIDTEQPWGVQSVDQVTRFDVFAEHLTD
jgi:hypothetical protein